MRGALVIALMLGIISTSVAVFALQTGSPAVAPRTGVDSPTSPNPAPALSSDRDFLSATEAEAAHRANLLPANVKSLLKTDKPLRHGEFQWSDRNVPAGKLVIWVDLRRQMISVLRDGHEIGTAVIVYGADGMASPVGRFPIVSKHRDYHSRTYDAPMPFSMFITNTGVALHGSPMSSRHATHGCIGLPIDFARLLFTAAKTGDEVNIVN